MPIISQREKPGFSRYPAVFAVEVAVDAVVAPRANACSLGLSREFVPSPALFLKSRTAGVLCPASCAVLVRLLN
jgi:hypothetical protein